ncbi:MAG TPA: type IV toxin-antitoxin system AbiEi family antitoxin domain-containing protein [Acidimicrobiia bacterium]|nr:type IV toxin-antitoxin system AbiEi family antitoxin domain-containing protein [Acidimicrobiia bacterium]
MRPDWTVDRLAQRQHGVFTRHQAEEAGHTEASIRHRIDSGRWLALTPGVYAVTAVPPTWERQMTAALLSRPGSVAAGASAAFLLDFPGSRAGRPILMAAASANARLSIGTVIRVSDFAEVATTTARGFRLTSVAETLWTLARTLPRDGLDDLVEQQVAMGHTTVAELVSVLDRVGPTRQRGLANFRRAVRRTDPGSESTASNMLEVVLYRLLSQPGIPSVTRQQAFLLDHPSRVDAYIPAWQLVVEADGRNWHTRQADFQRDRDRDNLLATRGILVVRFTYGDLNRRFDRCLRTLIAAGRHRRAMNVV